ncbi:MULTISPECIES: serine protease [Burkholderia]|nr:MULTISPECIES: serine protease [Burkholderia]
MKMLYSTLRERVVRVTVEDSNGDTSTGTAFHIGEGYFATARHVVQGFHGVQLDHTEGLDMIQSIEILSTYYPSDETIDVAVLKTNVRFTPGHLRNYKNSHQSALHGFKGIPFGFLIDDAVSDDHILSEVLLMGYPQIPMSDRSQLVAVRGEVNASMNKYIGSNHYFHLISTVARGGFSGGPVVDEYGVLLGVFIESLVMNSNPNELGFATVLSIEPLLRLLKNNGIALPANFNILDKNQPMEYDEWYEQLKADDYFWMRDG